MKSFRRNSFTFAGKISKYSSCALARGRQRGDSTLYMNIYYMRMHEQCVYECLSLLQCAYKSAVTTITFTPSKATKTIHHFIVLSAVKECVRVCMQKERKNMNNTFTNIFLLNTYSLFLHSLLSCHRRMLHILLSTYSALLYVCRNNIEPLYYD